MYDFLIELFWIFLKMRLNTIRNVENPFGGSHHDRRYHDDLWIDPMQVLENLIQVVEPCIPVSVSGNHRFVLNTYPNFLQVRTAI